jgi:hypothetical protein
MTANVLVCHDPVLLKEDDSCKMELTVGVVQAMCALPLAFKLTERFGSDCAKIPATSQNENTTMTQRFTSANFAQN